MDGSWKEGRSAERNSAIADMFSTKDRRTTALPEHDDIFERLTQAEKADAEVTPEKLADARE